MKLQSNCLVGTLSVFHIYLSNLLSDLSENIKLLSFNKVMVKSMAFMILLSISLGMSSSYTVYEKGIWCRLVWEHQAIPESQISLVKQWHWVGSKAYVMLIDGRDMWCDNVIEMDDKTASTLTVGQLSSEDASKNINSTIVNELVRFNESR